ncbi:MAG: NAD(P)/FAD-dependent oxidoreductase [Haloferacaceae archaeon]
MDANRETDANGDADADVVVVGSGVAGLASAGELAPEHDVLVVDAGPIGGGTSSRASGVITTPVDYPDLPEWADRAVEYFRDLDGQGVFTFEERPYVRPVLPDDRAGAERTADRDGVSLIDCATLADRYPAVFAEGALADYAGGLIYEGTGLLEADELLATMKRRAGDRGARFRPDTRVEGVRVADGAVTGVETEYGPVAADAVVVAAGSGTPALLDGVVDVPIRPFTWNVAVLDVGVDARRTHPIGGERSHELYWRPTRDGNLLVGTEYDLGWPDPAEPGVDPAFERRLRESVPDLLAGVADADLVRWEYCRRADATTPDARAIVDRTPVDGLVVAAGFHGTGVMSAGAVGTAVRALVEPGDPEERTPFPLDSFALDRFEDRGPDFPFASLFDAIGGAGAEQRGG